MLTGMTEDDWSIVLEVFDAAQSRRGEPGHDDRKFLEALHYFTVHNITWRALPAEFGNWNSVWKRFWRLSRSGVFEAFFQLLAETSQTAHLVQMFDSTVVRAHVSAAGAKGGSKIRRSAARAAGFSSKIHLKTDFDGLPIAFHLTGGEVSDSTQLETSLDIGPDITPRAAMTDKGYDQPSQPRGLPQARHRAGDPAPRKFQAARPHFSRKRSTKPEPASSRRSANSNASSASPCAAKRPPSSYAAFVSFACGLILVKSVHTA